MDQDMGYKPDPESGKKGAINNEDVWGEGGEMTQTLSYE
jgi:hypothetical protein